MSSDRAELERQYALEREFHHRILAESDAGKRRALYAEAYRRLYAEFLCKDPRRIAFGHQPYYEAMLRPFVARRVVVDFGCGLGASAFDLARHASRVIGFEVDESLVRQAAQGARSLGLANTEFRVLTEGRIGLPPRSVDVVFSSDVAEHLHPGDFQEFLRDSFQSLRPGGWAICFTPHRAYGPHDVSGSFLPKGAEAQGLHVHEYDFIEIRQAFRDAGFQRIYTAGLSPRILAQWRLAGLFRFLRRRIETTMWLEQTRLRRSGFCAGMLELTSIYLIARKS
ncbi:MAG: methyltransferase domain-containing protein [Candidatus Sumerlaeota bacterium]|nr:methyltransferase domain-containing protein [Candidatus Sumerlaeota bacterium]